MAKHTSARSPGAEPSDTPTTHRFYFKLNNSGQIFEVDEITMSKRAWSRRPESSDPAWQSIRLGRSVQAVRILF